MIKTESCVDTTVTANRASLMHPYNIAKRHKSYQHVKAVNYDEMSHRHIY